jgi:hypothetical protein
MVTEQLQQNIEAGTEGDIHMVKGLKHLFSLITVIFIFSLCAQGLAADAPAGPQGGIRAGMPVGPGGNMLCNRCKLINLIMKLVDINHLCQ